MDAAFQTFSRSGYNRGSLREVARRAGLSEAGLLHHFASKSELLIAVLQYRDDHARETFALAPESGRRALEELLRLAEYNFTVPGVVELFTTLAAEATQPDHPAFHYFKRRYESVRAGLASTLRHIETQGQLRGHVDPDIAAPQIVALWDGMQIQWLLNREAVSVPEHLRAYLNTLLTVHLDR
ncbi:TetR/AcrR family transcriptional regulator; helix-turn-helix transcriptional regulator [Microbacterium sp. EYE_5]|uniref:TetR/AcrR family transcriptional regulator n=1 Tax=unclassified Microbacterium TaxID=2609290 RepID=UPI00200338ED|nr:MULTISPECIES: TetR/AcrR family transcriptional regulator [unclassified Microbacterium]MCK6079405.1 TetR/AcrR family transcriptional regulator; helix-turn-helix transcriptional regulator [Microbacterium sp. EYE_382]MCK6084675.1 TetR/AcrR family transcriptional regulator; helix-turn-helix transcriptional regulator [Microbacterium sp. EYE_384]MCK6123096.1 TetR/AcrR family transcriptional regulator; helix-turn-helix transcriptional regulator [Microbacterium sp. EYE_80]MCK6125439.1 TetR/AcrR fami